MFYLMKDKTGFTLIEIMAVLVILGVIFPVTIKKFNNFADNAIIMQFDRIERELNVREMVTFADHRISGRYTDDAALYAAIDYNLGDAKWIAGPAPDGGQVGIKGITRALKRVQSSPKKPAAWVK